MKYTKANLKLAVENSNTFADVARYFGVSPHGGTQAHLKKRIVAEGINFSHFKGQGWNKGLSLPNKMKPKEEVLLIHPKGSSRTKGNILRRVLLELGVEEKCSVCGQEPIWNGKPLRLEVDHINGDSLDDRQDNLRFICLHCHSQTDTYRSKNRKRKSIGDENPLETGRACKGLGGSTPSASAD